MKINTAIGVSEDRAGRELSPEEIVPLFLVGRKGAGRFACAYILQVNVCVVIFDPLFFISEEVKR